MSLPSPFATKEIIMYNLFFAKQILVAAYGMKAPWEAVSSVRIMFIIWQK